MANNEHIQQLRSVMLLKDRVDNPFTDIEGFLLELLEQNKHNKMAFEYLMAFYMLKNQIDKVVENLHRLNDFDYPDMPRHIEEAVLLYMINKKEDVNMHGKLINIATEQSFRQFLNILEQFKTDKQQLFSEVIKNFGTSYFSYYLYGHPGGIVE